MASLNLADLFEAVVDHCPAREAIVVGATRLTYAGLDDRANRLAHHLAGLGVGPGDFIGLQLLNGTEYLEGMLAAFKLRAVPVNVNYRYVEDELAYLYRDAGLVALLVNERFADRALAARGDVLQHVMVLERDYEDALAAVPFGERAFPHRSADDLYCVYRWHHGPAQGRPVAPRGHLLRRPGGR